MCTSLLVFTHITTDAFVLYATDPHSGPPPSNWYWDNAWDIFHNDAYVGRMQADIDDFSSKWSTDGYDMVKYKNHLTV